MTWNPGPQADWVAEANRGERPEFEPAPWPFDAATLIDKVSPSSDTGFTWVESLDVVCRALEEEADLTPLGRWATQRFLTRLVSGRLQLDAYQIELAPIEAPVFVIGLPRSGTTVMHRLFCADPALRAPEAWEFLQPLPAPQQITFNTDPRIEATADELVFPQSVAQGLQSIHSYSSRMPKECLSAMSFSFHSEEFISRYNVPSYVDWLQGSDLTPAYQTHRHVLQVLQQHITGRRWVLKSPVHLQGLPELIRTYPDATLVFTHREPSSSLASVSSLIATMRSTFSASVDPVAIGQYHRDLYRSSLDRLVDHTAEGLFEGLNVVHVGHRQIVEDPGRAVERVYRELGWDCPDEVLSQAIAEATSTRSDALGAHQYNASDFGLGDTDDAFDRYRHTFLEGQ